MLFEQYLSPKSGEGYYIIIAYVRLFYNAEFSVKENSCYNAEFLKFLVLSRWKNTKHYPSHEQRAVIVFSGL